MGWLFRRVLVSVLVLTLLVGAFVVIRRTPDVPTLAPWFTYADGSPCPMPCLFGIRPGVTPFSEVDRLLDAHPLTRERHPAGRHVQPGTVDIDDYLFFGDEIIGRLYMYGDANGYPEAILISSLRVKGQIASFLTMLYTWGFPPGVSLSPYNYNETNSFSFSRQTTIIDFVGRAKPVCSFQLDEEISSLAVFSPSRFAEYMPPLESGSPQSYFPWTGFSRRTYYGLYYGPLGMSEFPCNE
jgi:hypothetical protein